MANTNTLSSVDLGFRMKRPGANVLAAYKGVAEEFVFAHATTGETPDASKQMNVHVYGAFFADESINVNSNCYIDTDGIVTANARTGRPACFPTFVRRFRALRKMDLGRRGHRPKSHVCECFDGFGGD